MFVALQLREAEPYLLDALRRAELAGLPLARLRVLQSLAFHDLARVGPAALGCRTAGRSHSSSERWPWSPSSNSC
jgi:hypothetical protein